MLVLSLGFIFSVVALHSMWSPSCDVAYYLAKKNMTDLDLLTFPTQSSPSSLENSHHKSTFIFGKEIDLFRRRVSRGMPNRPRASRTDGCMISERSCLGQPREKCLTLSTKAHWDRGARRQILYFYPVPYIPNTNVTPESRLG